MDLSLASLIILSLSFSLSRKEDKISETISFRFRKDD